MSEKLEQKLQTLQFQNGKLSAQLEVQRDQISDLETRVEAHEAKKTAYADTLLTVNSLWGQLNDDIRSLTKRAEHGPGNDPLGSTDEAQAQPDDFSADCDDQVPPDPYLRALLRGDAKATKEGDERVADLNDCAPDIEKQLRRRVTTTSAAFSGLLEKIDAARAAAAGNEPQEPSDKLQKVQQECNRLKAAADAGTALRRALNAQLDQANAHAMKQETAIKDLENDLADRCEELRAAQRKLVMARTASSVAADTNVIGGAAAAPSSPAAVKREPSTVGQSIAEIEAAVQTEQVAKLLEKRTAEVEAEKETISKLQREVRTLKSGLKDDEAVVKSRIYRELDRRAQGMGAELERQHGIIEGLHHQLENFRRRDHDLIMQVEALQHTRMQLQQCDTRLHEVTAALQAARSERDAAKAAAITASSAAPHKTVSELQAMLGTLQKQNKGLEAAVARHRAAAAATEALRTEATAARATLKERDELVRLANARVDARQATADMLRREAVDAAAAGDDLRIMVEVLRATDDGRSATDLRANEARLKCELQAATAKLNGKAPDAAAVRLAESEKAAAAREAELVKERDSLAGEAAALRVQISDLQKKLQEAKAESDAYIEEIETIGAAYEDMQGQNGRLLAQLADNDRVNNDIVAERVKAVSAAAKEVEEAERAREKMRESQTSAQNLQDQVAGLQQQLQALNDEAAGARQAARHAQLQLEAAGREARERDAALADRRSAAEAAVTQAETAKRSADEEADRCAKEKSKRQRLEEDNKVLQAKLDRLRKFDQAGGADIVLREEVAAQKKLLRCGVCNSRQKDCIITKCWHLFCHQCIRANLDARHRKCPGCGGAFGAADVKQVYLA